MHDIPEEAVKAALDHYSEGGCMGLDAHERREVTEAMLEAAAPYMQGVKVEPWGWVIPRGGDKKPIILEASNFDQVSAAAEADIHDLGYFPIYTQPATAPSPRELALEPCATDRENPVTDKTVKRRIADALGYVWSAIDCDVEHIESIIAHMQSNGLLVIESQNYSQMAEAVQISAAYLALSQPNSAEKLIADLDAALKPEVGIPTTELSELLERLDAGLEYEGELETENDHIELFNVEAAQDLFADAAAAIRALSSPDHADAGKLVEGDGIERAKFYHHQWPMERLLEARRDGLVDHSGGEAWRYEYSHKDEHGKYDILYRPLKNSTIPAHLPSAPASEGAE